MLQLLNDIGEHCEDYQFLLCYYDVKVLIECRFDPKSHL